MPEILPKYVCSGKACRLRLRPDTKGQSAQNCADVRAATILAKMDLNASPHPRWNFLRGLGG